MLYNTIVFTDWSVFKSVLRCLILPTQIDGFHSNEGCRLQGVILSSKSLETISSGLLAKKWEPHDLTRYPIRHIQMDNLGNIDVLFLDMFDVWPSLMTACSGPTLCPESGGHLPTKTVLLMDIIIDNRCLQQRFNLREWSLISHT